MQRPWTTSSRATNNHHAINLPLSVGGDNNETKRENSRPKTTSHKLIHVIPMIVLLCLFLLWYYSYPVELEIRDGRITAVHQQMETLDQIVNVSVDIITMQQGKATHSLNVSLSEILIAISNANANATFSPQPTSTRN